MVRECNDVTRYRVSAGKHTEVFGNFAVALADITVLQNRVKELCFVLGVHPVDDLGSLRHDDGWRELMILVTDVKEATS